MTPQLIQPCSYNHIDWYKFCCGWNLTPRLQDCLGARRYGMRKPTEKNWPQRHSGNHPINSKWVTKRNKEADFVDSWFCSLHGKDYRPSILLHCVGLIWMYRFHPFRILCIIGIWMGNLTSSNFYMDIVWVHLDPYHVRARASPHPVQQSGGTPRDWVVWLRSDISYDILSYISYFKGLSGNPRY